VKGGRSSRVELDRRRQQHGGAGGIGRSRVELPVAAVGAGQS